MKKESSEISHDGHRERVFDKVEAYGLGALNDHELLELYLFGSYRRRNTNDIAHALIDRFGSLKGVIDASQGELRSVKMVGRKSAIHINIVAEMMRRYLRINESKERFDSVGKVGSYFVNRFVGEGSERVYLLLLDNSMRFIDCSLVGEGSVNSVTFDKTRAFRTAFEHSASNVILAHNHPGGIAVPSEDDIRTNAILANGFGCLGINLVEHFVIADDRYTPIMRNSQNPAVRKSAEDALAMEDVKYISGKAEGMGR